MRLFSVIDKNGVRCKLGVTVKGLYHIEIVDSLIPTYSTKPKLVLMNEISIHTTSRPFAGRSSRTCTTKSDNSHEKCRVRKR